MADPTQTLSPAAADLLARIDANVAAYDAGTIDRDAWDVTQRALWDAIVEAGCRGEVLAAIRERLDGGAS
jgi:hypothetical protein